MGFTFEPLAIPPLLFALCCHEFSHAWSAFRLGDPTAALRGRLTLNPLRHLDPWGTLLLFVAGFGWAKPVPVDPRLLRRPRRDMVWIASAGPGANLVLALASGAALRLLAPLVHEPGTLAAHAATMSLYSLQINLVLACFNLIPLPPLDGSTVVRGLLPLRQAITFSRFEAYGPLVLFALVGSGFVLGFSPLGLLLGPPVDALTSWFTFGLLG